MKIQEIFKNKENFWREENIKFFGIEFRNWAKLSIPEINECLENDSKKYWNSTIPCEMARMILDGIICRNNKDIIKDSFVLKWNHISGCMEVFADFVKPDGSIAEDKLIASMPAPSNDLTWIINKTNYSPRVSATKDYNMVVKTEDNIVKQALLWEYDCNTNTMTINTKAKDFTTPYESLTNKSRYLLEAILGCELTEDNFLEALDKLPIFDRDSIFNYTFSHLDMFFNLIRSGSKFANPLKNIHLAVNSIFLKQADKNDISSGILVISKSPIFSLENFRTVMHKTSFTSRVKSKEKVKKKSYQPSFTFKDTKYFFDAFKTTTNKSAGRNRLLLDNVKVKNEMLYIADKDGVEYNMFEILNKESKIKSNISVISSSMFCNNNDPKRIMMTAKLSAQSRPVEGQSDEFTNRIMARVVFADLKGFNYADSILISESFAKKLNTKLELYSEISIKDPYSDIIFNKIEEEDYDLSYKHLSILFPKSSSVVLKNYTKSKITKFEYITEAKLKLTVNVEIPFMDGDKITNLHGSKGVAGKIIPDDKMPILKNDIGDFKAGPFEVIISGYSVLRRGSMGQIFEAWANASGIDFEVGEDFASLAAKKYAKEMKEFSNQSIVTLDGEECIKPCGMINMIRLYHYASTKVSQTYVKTNSKKMLKLAEMEKLNLAANGAKNILKELSIRSSHKHDNPYKHIFDIMDKRELPPEEDLIPSLDFARIMKSMGFEISLDGKVLVESDDTINQEFTKDETNDSKIDLYSLYNKEDIEFEDARGSDLYEDCDDSEQHPVEEDLNIEDIDIDFEEF